MLEIVAGVDDHQQVLGRQDARQAEGQLGAPHPAGQGDDHWNRSSSGGRITAATGASGADQVRPRTTTTGWPSAAWPCSRDAAAATSSANPTMLTSRMRPNRSGLP